MISCDARSVGLSSEQVQDAAGSGEANHYSTAIIGAIVCIDCRNRPESPRTKYTTTKHAQ